MATNKQLFTEFPPISKEDWIAKLEKDLKGKPLESLDWLIGADIAVNTFYTKEDLTALSVPLDKSRNDWEIGEDIYISDVFAGNTVFLKSLIAGVEAPRLIIDLVPSVDALTILTAGVEFNYISTHIKVPQAEDKVLEAVIGMLDGQEKSVGSIYYNPFEEGKNIKTAARLLSIATNALPNFSVLTLSSNYQSTATIPDELAQLINEASLLFDGLLAKGYDIDTINNYMQLEINIGTSYFANMAKLRAIKVLWLNLLKAYGSDSLVTPLIHAVTAIEPEMDNQNTNMIRTTTQAMAAVIGGADRLTVQPANVFEGESSDFTRRIARNVQYLLRYESYLDQVVDASKGSYYIETLTLKLANAAWKKFQEM